MLYLNHRITFDFSDTTAEAKPKSRKTALLIPDLKRVFSNPGLNQKNTVFIFMKIVCVDSLSP